MYQDYFGLQEQAFSIAVNPRYLYMTQKHKEALAHLLYGVQGGGFVMLTGEVGTGKTTIIRCLLDQLPQNTDIAIVLNPMSNVEEMLCTICEELGVKHHRDKNTIKSLTDALQAYLLVNHTKGKNTVLLIDEAQLLSAEVLEQIRLLTNLETSTQKLLQIILVGQPELNDLLAQPRLRQLSQRITARFHLTPLTLEETYQYISHRLSVAGMSKDKTPFSPKIIKQIHRYTGGIPRMINILCERALTGAYGHNKFQVDSEIFQLAKKEVEGNRQSTLANKSTPSINVLYVLGGATIVLLVSILIVLLNIFGPQDNSTGAGQEAITRSKGEIERKPSASSMPPIGSAIDADFAETDYPEATSNTPKFEEDYIIPELTTAQATLFDYLQIEVNQVSPPCWQVSERNIQCSEDTFTTWEELKLLNRPAVLSLITKDKFKAYALLIGIQDKHALLLGQDKKRNPILLEEIGPQWTGEIFYAWKKPKGYDKPIGIGSSHPAVAEIAEQFALLDTQPNPLTKKKFNQALQERIKIFQREHNLIADGIIGERTIMKLNEALGVSTTLEYQFL
ncbi:hypothetical protein TDB9533_02390 [Thalassocella blandensis]|nr:hypothetical protein TDB9533_02390 [Thalassocella blandensis]